MMSFKLKSDSWHFKVANFGSDWGRVSVHGSDICEYTRSFLIGLFWMSLAAVFTIFVATWVCFSIGNIFSWLFLGYLLAESAAIFMGLVVGLSFLALLVLFLDWRRKRQYERREQGIVYEPGFAALAYRKFKDKTCFRIEFDRGDK